MLENPTEPTEVLRFEGRLSHHIIGSCNGLLCLLEGFARRKSRVMLWNPCTGLASPSLKIWGFNPVCGFGYDHVNDKYKLCKIHYHIQEQKLNRHTVHYKYTNTTRIYTFCPKPSWRTIQDLPGNSIMGHHRGVFVPGTGTLNWEYGATQSWTKFAVIPCHPRLSGDYLRPLCAWGNDVLVVVASSSKMVLYNLDDGSFEFPVIDSSILKPTFDMVVESSFHIYHEA
ncbi:hypothetical protein PIB30_029690 [Stylosanthes scabra]|uniref:F-box associated beta-propeller type 3 domain-containing protein n=1 Tax=Stylosanthes scabra TaxID=79078 RepID=A0ABU6VDG4_9FABA|nr:hypothetical protein [Stylosanthes scabra]